MKAAFEPRPQSKLERFLRRVAAMLDRRWWVGALLALCVTVSAATLVSGLFEAIGSIVHLPFGFIGFLIGPRQSLQLSDFLPDIARWTVVMATAALAFYVSVRRATRHYAAGVTPPSAIDKPMLASAGVPVPNAASKWSSISAGLLVGLVLMQTVVSLRVPRPSDREVAAAAPLPATEADKLLLRERWLPDARKGDAYAQFVVAEVFRSGLMGEVPRPGTARSWLEKGAAQGDVDARLSLLVSQRLGQLGGPQRFDITPELESLAISQSGWRRAAIELLLAFNPPVVVGSGAPLNSVRDRWMNAWLEKAARSGSRYAAFALARSLELKRTDGNELDADYAGAMRWYAYAGAAFELSRLLRAHPTVRPLAPEARTADPPATADELDKLARRSEMVAVREAGKVVSIATDDAFMHFVVHAEATHDYMRLAEACQSSTPPTAMSGDTRLAAMYYLLAAREGNKEAVARLKRLGFPSR